MVFDETTEANTLLCYLLLRLSVRAYNILKHAAGVCERGTFMRISPTLLDIYETKLISLSQPSVGVL